MVMKILYSITDIERETGIGRDTLRIWERRYGFPAPQRNHRGERIYSSEELERLRLLKQLLDTGMQPGKLIKLDEHQLRQLTSQKTETAALSADVELLLTKLSTAPRFSLMGHLEKLLQQYGLSRFLTEVVAPMNHAVGEAWFAGRIGIIEEHQYAEEIRIILINAMCNLPQDKESPRVLLTTLPGEPHSIGLLMVACILRLERTNVLSIGVQTPLEEIVRGAVDSNSHIVGISCSEYITPRNTASLLVRLRKMLPDHILLWAGGSGVKSIRLLPSSIRLFNDLNQVTVAIQTESLRKMAAI